MPLLSVVAPSMNESESVPAFSDFARELAAQVKRSFGLDTEFVIVDDGSTDDSVARYRAFMTGNWRIVELSRNFGKEIALFAGFEAAAGDYVLSIDADLQHPYDMCIRLVEEMLGDEDMDVIYCVRDDRMEHSWKRAVAANMFYGLMNYRQRFEIPQDAGDFRIMRRTVVDAFLQVRDRRRFNKGLYAWAGFRQKAIRYRPAERAAGSTKWNRLSLLGLSVEGITSFSALPLRTLTLAGALVGIMGMLHGLWVIVEVYVHGIDVPGFPSLMVAVTVLGGFNLAMVGLIGEYLWVNTAESKNRPLYLVRRVHHSPVQEEIGGRIKTAASARKTRELIDMR
jgi:glycosyltransferase involved in cell wall biosynthesis